MHMIRNIFAFLGLIAVIALGYGYWQVRTSLQGYDPDAPKVLASFVKRALSSDIVSAMVIKMPVAEDVTLEDAIDSLKLRANVLNIKLVGEKPLHKQVEAMMGKPYRVSYIFELCDAMTAAKMLDYNPDLIAFMPCRVALFEDTDKKLWLATMNMDLMIYGAKALPPNLKKEAIRIRDGIMDIMKAAAAGEL
ncbi:MAG: DUF302 domain-containing protein [Gammaproteobacteria bacterium]|nr:MAG: DUF302 domain-containing protein [Gammaproteobacteria bacterium]